MNKSKSSNSFGMSFLVLLGLIFIVLKLTGFINWSWWWVTMPFWVGIAITTSIISIIILLIILYYLLIKK